ncbi:tandem five-TM protein [Staphylococcus lugdunensis]|nr:tandem five-TM protein [Staphylococcus lugdunensis]
MLCESKIIRMNPKYRIIKYNNDYFMVDTISHWITFLFPMINWFVPKRYAKLSEEEYNNLDIVKPVKNSGASIGLGIAILINVLFRKYIFIFDVQVQQSIAVISCIIGFLCVFIFFLYINKKVTLDIYKINKTHSKIILIPTLKNIGFTLFSYIFLGGFVWMILYGLTVENLYNIFIFIIWIGSIALFFFSICLRLWIKKYMSY